MVASTIAYAVSIVLAVMGGLIIWMSMFTKSCETRGVSVGASFLVGVGFLGAGWLCAHLGGV